MSDRSERKGAGRPRGSVKLTPEIERTILSFIEAGAWDYVAAEAAGIDARTFRDWMARGEGRHSSRSTTPRLAAFASAVREARARARAAREIEVARHEPKFWLSHQARSKPGREGWTEPVPDEQNDSPAANSYEPTPEQAAETVRILIDAGAIELPRCTDPECSCSLHQEAEDG
ncbi:MAG: hypothetical protein ACRDHS_13930 [Actinomycetota bacterium]